MTGRAARKQRTSDTSAVSFPAPPPTPAPPPPSVVSGTTRLALSCKGKAATAPLPPLQRAGAAAATIASASAATAASSIMDTTARVQLGWLRLKTLVGGGGSSRAHHRHDRGKRATGATQHASTNHAHPTDARRADLPQPRGYADARVGRVRCVRAFGVLVDARGSGGGWRELERQRRRLWQRRRRQGLATSSLSVCSCS